ncbi:MAG TPA: TetR/AcrR family transcriptional regulator [Chloroflexi bacterium]|mgnify:CR=1 FL=1|nr:TetR/AcrR family transcriptional regulator [Chloroflexota bacterium]
MFKEFTIRTFSSDEALVKERRKHIVRCSTKLFTKKGYDRTNMRELAKACKMSAGTLYHYFGSKEEILYAIINNATSQQAGFMEDCADELAAVSPTTALVELIGKFYEWHDDNQDITLFAYQETKNLPGNARQSIFDSEARILAVFEELLTRGVEEGEFNVDNPELIAHDIVVLGHAWALRRWYLRKHWTFKTYVKEQTDAMLRAITVDKNTAVSKRQRKE